MSVTADELDFQALLDASAEAVVVHDPDSEAIVWANRAASAIYGYSHEQLTRLSVTDLAAPDPRYTRASARSQVDQALRKDHHTFEWRIRTKAGDEFPIETTATYVSWRGQRAIMIQFRDISDRKVTETALKRYEHRFHEFMHDLEEGVLILSNGGLLQYQHPGLPAAGLRTRGNPRESHPGSVDRFRSSCSRDSPIHGRSPIDSLQDPPRRFVALARCDLPLRPDGERPQRLSAAFSRHLGSHCCRAGGPRKGKDARISRTPQRHGRDGGGDCS
jgi:PAS domain S-box-containing protein